MSISIRYAKVIVHAMVKYFQVNSGKTIVFKNSLQFLIGSLQLTDALQIAGGLDRLKHFAAAVHPTYGIQPSVDI